MSVTLHSSLHSLTTDNSKCLVSPMMMRLSWDFLENYDSSGLHVSLDWTWFPSVIVRLIGTMVMHLLIVDTLIIIK